MNTFTEESLTKDLIKALSELLYIDEQELDAETRFNEIGLDSILSLELTSKLNKAYDLRLGPNALIQYPTVKEFVVFFKRQTELR